MPLNENLNAEEKKSTKIFVYFKTKVLTCDIICIFIINYDFQKSRNIFSTMRLAEQLTKKLRNRKTQASLLTKKNALKT